MNYTISIFEALLRNQFVELVQSGNKRYIVLRQEESDEFDEIQTDKRHFISSDMDREIALERYYTIIRFMNEGIYSFDDYCKLAEGKDL